MSTDAQRVVVLGASPRPGRYSLEALRLLRQLGHEAIPVHPSAQQIDGLPVFHDLGSVPGRIDTLTLYLNPQRSRLLIDTIVQRRPGRVILNPGSESAELERALAAAGIPSLLACTLVMLRNGLF